MPGTKITPSRREILRGDAAYNRPNSESTMFKFGGSINYLLDRNFIYEDFLFSGYFNADSKNLHYGYAGIKRIRNLSNIIGYYAAIQSSGTSGNSIINCQILDDQGSFSANLFGSGANRLLIAGGGNSRIVVGRDIVASETFAINPNGNTVQYGNLSTTQLNEGSLLVPFVESRANGAYNLFFRLILAED